MSSLPTDTIDIKLRSQSSWRLWMERLGPLLALILVTLGFAIADQIWGQGRFIEIRNAVTIGIAERPLACSVAEETDFP